MAIALLIVSFSIRHQNDVNNFSFRFWSCLLQEISTHDGILLKKGPALFLNEILNSTTGTLSLVHYVSNKLYIEWRSNDHYMIADADTQEPDDWSIVDTIIKRQRTASECAAFSTSNSSCTLATNTQNQLDERQTPPQNKQKILRTLITDLKHIDVMKGGHLVRLISKLDGKANSEYFFQNGNADGFVRSLQTTHCLRRNRNYKNQYEIVENVECDTEKLQKTFAELKIDEIKASKVGGGWISSMVRNPLEHTIDFLAKMSDVYTTYPGTDQSVQQYSPTPKSDLNNSTGDDYEVLSTSPRPPDTDADAPHVAQLPPRPTVLRGPPLSEKQWHECMSEDGRISDSNRVKEIIFRGGIDERLRREVWKYLLNYFDWNASAEQRIHHRNQKGKEYYQMKLQWLSMSEMQEKNFADYRDRKCQIEKDVKRTDRTLEYFAGDENPNLGLLQDILMTYVMYNFDLGYVQGMSDLLAPILSTMDHEVTLLLLPPLSSPHNELLCQRIFSFYHTGGRILVLCRFHGFGIRQFRYGSSGHETSIARAQQTDYGGQSRSVRLFT